jgi:hypothetical protein
LSIDWKPCAARALLADRKILRLGLVEDLRHLPALRVEGGGGDLVAGGDQLAQDGPLAHDLGVAAQVGRAGHALRQRIQVGQAAASSALPWPCNCSKTVITSAGLLALISAPMARVDQRCS